MAQPVGAHADPSSAPADAATPAPDAVQAKAELLMDPSAAASVPAPTRGLAIADVDDDEEGGAGGLEEGGWGEAR